MEKSCVMELVNVCAFTWEEVAVASGVEDQGEEASMRQASLIR